MKGNRNKQTIEEEKLRPTHSTNDVHKNGRTEHTIKMVVAEKRG